MLALFQERPRDREMRIGRRGDDAASINPANSSSELVARTLYCSAISAAVAGVGVVNRGEIGRARFGVEAGVIFSDVPDPDDSDPQIFHERARLENAKDMPESASEPQP